MAATAALVLLLTAGACQEPGVEDTRPDPVPSASTVAEDRPAAKAKPGVHRLAADERRVKLLVLPADAAVEVDGVPMRRRDGIIEISGKVGETHRVRLSRDAQHAETTVTIKDAGASPPLLDLAALMRAARPLGRGLLPTASIAEPVTADDDGIASIAPELVATADPAPDPALPEVTQGSAPANEGQGCACPVATTVVIQKCPSDAAAAAHGKRPWGVLGGESFE